MRKEDSLIFSFSLAMLFFSLCYFLNFALPRYYPLEGVWLWEKLADAPSMGWYARFGWSLLASGVAALAGHFMVPPLLARMSTPQLHLAALAAWSAAILMYAIAAVSVVAHEWHLLV